jgi:hypothetical protein
MYACRMLYYAEVSLLVVALDCQKHILQYRYRVAVVIAEELQNRDEMFVSHDVASRRVTNVQESPQHCTGR